MTIKTFVLLVSALLLFGRPVHAGICADIKPWQTRINIDVIIPEPHYDLTKSEKQLTRTHRDTTEKWLENHKMEVLWKADDMHMAGVASGGQSLVYDAAMQSRHVDRYGAYHCTFFKEINIAVFYRTLIFIASDFPEGSCAFNDVHEHELRHHNANKTAVERYTARLKQDIYQLVAMMEEGYVPRNEIESRFEEMELGMRDAVQIYLRDYVRRDMKKLNAQIDTPEEYKRSGHAIRKCREIDGHKAVTASSR